MKRLNPLEKVGLFMGVVFIALGIYSIVHPPDVMVFHAGSGRFQTIIGYAPPELVTKDKARVYGVLAVGLGGGLLWIALNRPRK